MPETQKSKVGRRIAAVLLTVAVPVALFVFTPAGAHINDRVGHVWDHIRGKADKRYLQKDDAKKTYARRLWVVVNWGPPGPLPFMVRGKGVEDVENAASGEAGTADDAVIVTFNRNVGKCSYVASLSEEDTVNGGEIITYINPTNGATNEVRVQGFDSSGNESGRGFSLAVIC